VNDASFDDEFEDDNDPRDPRLPTAEILGQHGCPERGCPCWTVHYRPTKGFHAGHEIDATFMPGDGAVAVCDCGVSWTEKEKLEDHR